MTKTSPSDLKPQTSAFSLQTSAFSLQPSAFSLQPSAFSPQPSAFSLQTSPLTPRLAFLIHLGDSSAAIGHTVSSSSSIG